MRIIISAILILCFWENVYIVQAQEEQDDNVTNQEWYLNKPISGFDFQGLKTINRSDLNNVLSEYKGKPFTTDLLYEMQNVLYGLNFFSELVPEAKRGPNNTLIITFSFTELPTISKITFLGNKKLGASALLNVIDIRRNEIVDDFKINRDIKSIEKAYFNQGYPNITVSSKTLPDPNNPEKVHIEFYIDEGRRITISDITFTGNTIFSANKLSRVIQSRKRSILSKGTFSENTLIKDKELIKQAYFKRGFLDAQVVDVNVERRQDSKNANNTIIILQFVIVEGIQYIFDNIVFEGNSVFSTKELLALFPLKKGSILDLTKFQSGYDRLRLMYADSGFIFNRFEYKKVQSEDPNKVSFLITIQEFGQSHIENIIIKGNLRTKDFVIRRELGFEEGDVFSAGALNRARLNLMNLRYFKQVLPDSRPGSAPGLIDLIFNLEEDRSRDIQVGASFGGSTEFPVNLFLKWNEPNLFGRGIIWNNRLVVSALEQSVSSTFAEPRLFGSPFTLSATLEFSHQLVQRVPQDLAPPFLNGSQNNVNYDDYTGKYVFTNEQTYKKSAYKAGNPFPGAPTANEISYLKLQHDFDYFGARVNSVYNNSLMKYDNYSISASVGSGYTYFSPFGTLGTRVSLGPTFAYVHYDKRIYRPADIQVRRNLETWRVYNIMNISLFYDSRDISYMPSKGIYLKQSLSLVGGLLFGDAHYIRTTTVAEGHVTLFDWKLAENWSWKMVLAAQSVFTAIVPQFFYPKGTSFKKNGPTFNQRLRLNGIFNARGWHGISNGEATWNFLIELRMPLYEPVVWWDQFFEVASLWSDLQQIGTSNTNYYFTFGTGLRFVMRQFPIRLYIGKRFSYNVQTQEFKWQRGNIFTSSDPTDTSGVDLIFTLGLDFF